jgi:hypothetical protein
LIVMITMPRGKYLDFQNAAETASSLLLLLWSVVVGTTDRGSRTAVFIAGSPASKRR